MLRSNIYTYYICTYTYWLIRVDDRFSRVGTEPQVVLHAYILYVCWFSSQQTSGTLFSFCPLPIAKNQSETLWIQPDSPCLTGSEEFTPTGTRRAQDWGQHAQHIKKKLWCWWMVWYGHEGAWRDWRVTSAKVIHGHSILEAFKSWWRQHDKCWWTWLIEFLWIPP